MTVVGIVLASFILLEWIWRHVVTDRTLREDPTLRARADAPVPEAAPLISVLIPARNEAGNLRRTLDALLTQSYDHFEVIVADDRSQDDTERIVREAAERDPRVHLVSCGELPEGWTGKNHALQQASRRAHGEILLFLDADVALDAGALAVMTSHFLENRLDMLSMILRLDSHSFWEKTARLLAGSLLILGFPLRDVNDPDSPRAFANGQIIMTRAEVYRLIGGHEGVKSALLEDLALAGHIKRGGHRLRVAYGFDMAATRMYASLTDFWRGWTRIFCNAFYDRRTSLVVSLLLLLFFSLSPYVVLILSAVQLLRTGVTTVPVVFGLLGLAQIAVMMSLMVKLSRATRCETTYVAFHPLAVVMVCGILCSAIAKAVSPGEIVWKGRRYPTRPARRQDR